MNYFVFDFFYGPYVWSYDPKNGHLARRDHVDVFSAWQVFRRNKAGQWEGVVNYDATTTLLNTDDHTVAKQGDDPVWDVVPAEYVPLLDKAEQVGQHAPSGDDGYDKAWAEWRAKEEAAAEEAREILDTCPELGYVQASAGRFVFAIAAGKEAA